MSQSTRYSEFLSTKRRVFTGDGIRVAGDSLNAALFPFQRDLTRWALAKGRAALFAGTGLGKTAMQLEWARVVCEHTGGDVLILAPLAVAEQTVREGAKFGIPVTHARDASDLQPGVNVTNYERLHRFDPSVFAGVVLDESSILKSYDGATRTQIVESFGATPYRLACTATPAPNDYMELGNHAEFLGVMSRVEMLSMFFVHDGGETQSWRLKGHAEADFWRWICSWAVMLRAPSDLGYEDGGFALPALEMQQHSVGQGLVLEGMLFAVEAHSMDERRAARRASLADRVSAAAALVNAEPDQPWIVWCDLNDESKSLVKAIPGAVEITGSDDEDVKAGRMLGFADGAIRVLVTKPAIAGHGMNWQHCARIAFVGLSDSWEQYYQAIRRCWRFGQTRPVACHVIASAAEGAVLANIDRKERQAEAMLAGMVEHMRDMNRDDLAATNRETDDYLTGDADGKTWRMLLGDCVERIAELPDASVDYSIYSPPFASIYTYSNSTRDMGNCASSSEFYDHFRYLTRELIRVLKPGRLMSVHCMNIPAMKVRDGYIGIHDFRGDLIRIFQEAGFIYHSEVVIWKDPVTAMQRTKALGLLYKQIKKDSAMSRQGIPDYLVTMRVPGVNPDPVTKDPEQFPVSLWQRYASPVWFDINPSDTLQRESAREERDERHIAPLQLDVIRRAITLWTNPGDVVLSPFAGIGSEGHVALELGRRFIGMELKHSYYRQAVANLTRAEDGAKQPTLFDLLDDASAA